MEKARNRPILFNFMGKDMYHLDRSSPDYIKNMYYPPVSPSYFKHGNIYDCFGVDFLPTKDNLAYYSPWDIIFLDHDYGIIESYIKGNKYYLNRIELISWKGGNDND